VGFVDAIRGAFSFLSARSQAEERIAQYVIREHHRGRPLAEILNDHYVTNRLTPVQVKRLLDEPDLLVVGSGIRLLLPGNRTPDWPGRQERISYQLLLRNRVKELHCSTLVMRREALVKVGLYDEELPYSYGLDYDWVLRAAKVGSIGLVAQPLADIRKDGTSWYQGGAHKTAEGLECLLAKHPDIATSRRGHARILGQIAYARSSLGERGPALRYALRALSKWPLSPHPYIALVQITTRIHPPYVLRAAQLLRRGQA